MVSPALLNEAVSLAPNDRLSLMGALWDSLSDVPPTAEEYEAAKESLASYRQNPSDVEDFDTVIAELEHLYV
ncbi:MAG: addiction module protein [Propionibacteriaceae bacterium]|jgi:hypothetical protein|nr:addiction module protein [Propionibacteriaceae bacterium]